MLRSLSFIESPTGTRWAFLLLSLSLLPLMISSESLWIDESYNALFAMQHSFDGFLNHFLEDTRSENQMPLGMFYSWFGGITLGTSEWEIRLINIPWGAITIGCFYSMGKRYEMPWLPLFMAIQPFFWFYMNEARPYAMQIASGSVLFLSVIEADEDVRHEARWLPLFLLGSLILCASSLLGVIPFFVYLATLVVILVQKGYRPSRSAIFWISTLFFFLACLALFYLWTLWRGAGGAKLWHLGLANVAFIFYDFLGFGGLGPSREALRYLAKGVGAEGSRTLVGFIPELLILAGSYLGVILFSIKNGCYVHRAVRIAAMISLGSFALMIAACYGERFPFWARHLAAIFPAMVFIAVFGLRASRTENSSLRKLLLMLLFLMLTISSLRTRFAPEYAKDDYRSAAGVAKEALRHGNTVWWAADKAGAEYYGVISSRIPMISPGVSSGRVLLVQNPDETSLAMLPSPDLVILSKVDIYDAGGSTQQWIKEQHLRLKNRFPAFTVWSK